MQKKQHNPEKAKKNINNAVKPFKKFSKKSLTELVQDQEELEKLLGQYTQSFFRDEDTVGTKEDFTKLKRALKFKFLELSHGQVDVSDCQKFPTFHVSRLFPTTIGSRGEYIAKNL